MDKQNMGSTQSCKSMWYKLMASYMLIQILGVLLFIYIFSNLESSKARDNALYIFYIFSISVSILLLFFSPKINRKALSYAVSLEDIKTLGTNVGALNKKNIPQLLAEAFLLALRDGREESAEILKSHESFSMQKVVEIIPTIQDQQTLKALVQVASSLIFQHLETSIENNDITRVKFLQECGIEPIKAMVKQASPEMRLALMGDKIKKAFEDKDLDYLKTVKDYDIVLTSEQNSQLFTIAVEKQDFAYAEELLKDHVDISQTNLSDFVKGILSDNLAMFKKGIQGGKIPADLWDYKHALIHACNNGQIKLLEVAAQEVKDINELCINGDALLHVATRYNMTSVVKILLERGADVNVKNREGRTPVYLAAEAKLPEVGLLLFNAGGNV